MQKALQSKFFWTLFVIFSLIVFIVLINANRTYESKSDVLIIAKSELAAKNFEQIIGDISYIPHTLSFYDRMVADNDKLSDNSKGLSPFERKLLWERKIDTERIAKSGVIRITVSDPDRYQSEMIGSQTGITLASYLSRTYDIKTDVDFRIIDGPITSYAIRYNFFVLLFLSFLGGLMISFLIYRIFSPLSRMKPQSRDASLPVSLVELLREKNKKPGSLSYEEEKPAIISHNISGAKAAAPDNLPIADETNLVSLKPSDRKEKEEEIAKDTSNINHTAKEPTSEEVENRLKKLLPKDPTPEEVKERLNKLLSGEL